MMLSIEDLPDCIFSHILSFILSELRKLCAVSTRFRGSCMMPHFYSKFILELNPQHFTKSKSVSMEFQSSNDHRVIIMNPKSFLSSTYTSIPWKHFNVFDLHLMPNQKKCTNEIQNCIDLILPHFNSIEISPTTKKRSDVVYIGDDFFSNKVQKQIYHLSLNGRIHGMHKLFHYLLNIQYLELNFVSYPETNWISDTISRLPLLLVLDLWRCEWEEQSEIILNKSVQIFRIFDCTLDTFFDFRQCKDNLRVVSTDCDCILSSCLLDEISDYNNVHILLSHIRNASKYMETLERLMLYPIDNVHVVHTRDACNEFAQNQDRQIISYVLDDGKKHQMTVHFSKLDLCIFAMSHNYSFYRKLLKIGRLRGTFVWKQ